MTTVARTLLDLAAILTRNQVVRAIEAAERNELCDLRQVEAVAARYPAAVAQSRFEQPSPTTATLSTRTATSSGTSRGLIRKAALPILK